MRNKVSSAEACGGFLFTSKKLFAKAQFFISQRLNKN
jgi:hypothetical protein